MRAIRRIVVSIVALTVLSLVLTVAITLGIWPGEVKLLAPLFCTDAQPDAFVVTDTYSTADGESTTDFTMYCVGESGDATDVGWAGPFTLLVFIHAAILFVVGFVVVLLFRLRRAGRRRGDDTPPGAPPTPHFSGPIIS